MVNLKSRAITLLAVLLLGTVVLIISLSASGLLDPTPDGETVWQRELTPIQIFSKSTEFRWLMEDLPDSPLSIRLTAAHDSGEPDSGYGLLLGQGDGEMVVMVSPLGYAAISHQASSSNSDSVDYFLPWQTWPHIRTGNEANELLVYLDGDTITVRVNREWLWEASEIERVDRIGIIGTSYGQDVSIDFQFAEVTAVDNGR